MTQQERIEIYNEIHAVKDELKDAINDLTVEVRKHNGFSDKIKANLDANKAQANNIGKLESIIMEVGIKLNKHITEVETEKSVAEQIAEVKYGKLKTKIAVITTVVCILSLGVAIVALVL